MPDPTRVADDTTSRTTESVAAVVKAYDVRGLVGEQIDEQFVGDVGRSGRCCHRVLVSSCGSSSTRFC